MARWRIWLAAGVGLAPASDVVAALAGMDRRTVRQVRRLLRRGLVAPDAPRARLAVALARDFQRRQPGPLLTVFFTAIIVGWGWFFGRRVAGGQFDPLTLLWGATAAWGIWMGWALWRMRRGAPRAELRTWRSCEMPASRISSTPSVNLPKCHYQRWWPRRAWYLRSTTSATAL